MSDQKTVIVSKPDKGESCRNQILQRTQMSGSKVKYSQYSPSLPLIFRMSLLALTHAHSLQGPLQRMGKDDFLALISELLVGHEYSSFY